MKKVFLTSATVCAFLAACTTMVGNIDMGMDTSEYANDGECDDPRFTGGGMAQSLSPDNIRADATDCANLLMAQKIRPVRTRDQWSPQMCSNVSFGNNNSEYARDGECDDPRFTGPGVHRILLPEDRMTDAADCRALCRSGDVWLR